MEQTVDVVIIGAGVAGMSAAVYASSSWFGYNYVRQWSTWRKTAEDE